MSGERAIDVVFRKAEAGSLGEYLRARHWFATHMPEANAALGCLVSEHGGWEQSGEAREELYQALAGNAASGNYAGV